jgi:Flp pilus assembly protein protease CpaA
MAGISPPAGSCLAVTFAMFAVGGMGGGDAKLLAATAVWMGMSMELMQYVFYGAMIGGVLTLLIVFYRGSPLSMITGQHMLPAPFRQREGRRSLWRGAGRGRTAGLPLDPARAGHWSASPPAERSSAHLK